MKRNLFLMPDATEGGGTPGTPNTPPPGGTPPLNDFVKSLPVDLQAEKSLHHMTDPVTLAKSYVHAQKMIGAKRLAAPDGTWGESQWNEFYEAAGRPKTADEYKVAEFTSTVDPTVKVDSAKMKSILPELHKAGLSQKQVDAVMTQYYKNMDEGLSVSKSQRENVRASAESTLKGEWGDKYDVNVNIAKSVVTKFGSDELNQYIADGGGNDPRLIKFLANVGTAMLEDKSRGGSAADGLQVTDQTRATQEINRLKLDKDFQAAMVKKDHPGHKAAVQQWMNLHKIASPGQVQPQ